MGKAFGIAGGLWALAFASATLGFAVSGQSTGWAVVLYVVGGGFALVGLVVLVARWRDHRHTDVGEPVALVGPSSMPRTYQGGQGGQSIGAGGGGGAGDIGGPGGAGGEINIYGSPPQPDEGKPNDLAR
ncbi:MAG: hypothetical protein M3019_06595 [Candidatus Dormibacteraeota bacterium]|nr:hypothetical protein [Candidatus Dormibacteraeota bacterium]